MSKAQKVDATVTANPPLQLREQQSPINIRPTLKSDAPSNYLHLNWDAAVDGIYKDGDHGIEIIFRGDPREYLELDGKRYHLRNFHFHHPSEHFVENEQFDAEVHVVHQNSEDAMHAVVCIFLKLDKSAKPSEMLKRFVHTMSNEDAGTKHFEYEPAAWLPEITDNTRTVRYEGSLTTPPYGESVSWIVFPQPMLVNRKTLDAVKGADEEDARALQALNRRYVIEYAGGITTDIPPR